MQRGLSSTLRKRIAPAFLVAATAGLLGACSNSYFDHQAQSWASSSMTMSSSMAMAKKPMDEQMAPMDGKMQPMEGSMSKPPMKKMY